MTRLRVQRRTRTTANGTKVTTTKVVEAPELEWKLQAAAVRDARRLPGFGAKLGPGVTFTLAGDMNAGKRGRTAQAQALLTGMVSGEPDARFYILGGRLGLIEYKGARGKVSPEQRDRHELLRGLGFDVRIVKAASESDASAQTLEILREWLLAAGVAANDNVAAGENAA